MINYKIEKGLQNWSNWYEVSGISIDGDPNAQKFSLENTLENAEENEKTIQSWKQIAVLKTTSNEPTGFYVGYYDTNFNLFLKHELRTDKIFGMRVGPYPIRFYALPKDLQTEVKLELIEITSEDDKKYTDLIVL